MLTLSEIGTSNGLLIITAGLQLGLIFNYAGLVEESLHLNILKLLKPIPRIYEKKRGNNKSIKKITPPTIRISANTLGHVGFVSNDGALMWHQILSQDERA